MQLLINHLNYINQTRNFDFSQLAIEYPNYSRVETVYSVKTADLPVNYLKPGVEAAKPKKGLILAVLGEKGPKMPLISSQILKSDKPENIIKRLLNTKILQFVSGLVTVKNWVSVFDRSLLSYKYKLLKTACLYAGSAGGEILEAFVFGSVKSLEKTTLIGLKNLGLLHIASASGANVMIVMQLVKYLTNRLKSKPLQFYLLVLVVGIYAELAEFSPSIVRSGISAIYRLFGQLILNVPSGPLIVLIWSMLTMLAVNPAYLTNLSFQLSCLATFGLSLFSSFPRSLPGGSYRNSSLQLPASQATHEKILIDGFQPQTATQSGFWTGIARNLTASYRYCVQTLSDSLKTSLSAQVFVAPFIWLRLGQWSPFSLVANTLLLWLTPLITQLGLALLLVTAWAGQWPLELCWYLQRIIGQLLNLITEVFLFGVANLSQVLPALSFHRLDGAITCSWWLLSGLLVAKTYQQTHRRHDDLF